MGLRSLLKEIFTAPEDEWSLESLGWRTVRSIDGNDLTGWVMQRKINGVWQYRALTAEEAKELRYDTYW